MAPAGRPRAAQPALRRGPRGRPRPTTDALAQARRLAVLLGHQGRMRHRTGRRRRSTSPRCCPSRRGAPTTCSRWSTALLDEPGIELHPKWAPNIVTTLGRLGGRTVGVDRQQPDAARRLPRRHLGREGGPVRADVRRVRRPAGRARRRARLPARVSARSGTAWSAAARSCCTRSPRRSCRGSPWSTRKAYGGAYIAMNSRVARRDPGVRLADRRGRRDGRGRRGPHPAPARARRRARRSSGTSWRPQLAEEHEKVAGGLQRARELGVIDEVIEPGQTRQRDRPGHRRRARRARRARQHPALTSAAWQITARQITARQSTAHGRLLVIEHELDAPAGLAGHVGAGPRADAEHDPPGRRGPAARRPPDCARRRGARVGADRVRRRGALAAR